MSIDHVMYVTEHMMNYLIGKEEELSVVTTVEGREQDFFNERDRLHMRDVRNLFLGGVKVGVICLAVAAVILAVVCCLVGHDTQRQIDFEEAFMGKF